MLVPELLPVTMPLVLMDARLLLLDHVPPVALLLKVVVLPKHTLCVPVIAGGGAVTLNTAPTVHPADVTTEIIVVPVDTALTIPEALMVATLVLELLHDAAAGVLVSPVLIPGHAAIVPPIIGIAFTVTTRELRQPVMSV